jgi:hypothetical protein
VSATGFEAATVATVVVVAVPDTLELSLGLGVEAKEMGATAVVSAPAAGTTISLTTAAGFVTAAATAAAAATFAVFACVSADFMLVVILAVAAAAAAAFSASVAFVASEFGIGMGTSERACARTGLALSAVGIIAAVATY